jgi:serine protease Do
MDRLVPRLLLTSLLTILQASITHALDSHTERSIRAATFEFVAPGNGADSESLVGTAFAIGPNEFVTAAHLLDATVGSHFGHPVLVDAHHVGYRIADVLQFSEQEDYAVFSLERPPAITPLPTLGKEETPYDLYFAGWHSSQKIVFEHATLAATTPDEVSKESDWLRFSGQVWNSAGGGPLLDNSGHVVGIVQASARDAGANYAAPIGILSGGAPHQARIHSTEMLRSLMPAVWSNEPLKGEIPLPMPFDQFAHELQQLRLAYFDRMITPLLEATRRDFVLIGAGAAEVCSLLNGQPCQCKRRGNISGVLVLDNSLTSDMLLRITKGEEVSHTIAIAGILVLRTRDIGVQQPPGHDLPIDSSLHLSLALKAQPPSEQRLEAGPRIPFRAGLEQEVYTDFHERTWYLRTWPLGHRDLMMVSLARRLPDGYVVLTRTVPTALRSAAALQVKFVANLVNYGCDELPAEGVAQVADRSPNLNETPGATDNCPHSPPS